MTLLPQTTLFYFMSGNIRNDKLLMFENYLVLAFDFVKTFCKISKVLLSSGESVPPVYIPNQYISEPICYNSQF